MAGWADTGLVAIGGAFSLLGGVLGAWQATRLEKARWDNQAEDQIRLRRIGLDDNRAAFQRETLVALQDQLTRLGRACGAAHHVDVMAERATGVWGRNRVPEQVDQDMIESTMLINKLVVRVVDDAAREGAALAKSAFLEVPMSRTSAEAERRLFDAMPIFETANERIGHLLRTLY